MSYTIDPMDLNAQQAAKAAIEQIASAINGAQSRLTSDQIAEIGRVTGLYVVTSMKDPTAVGFAVTNEANQSSTKKDLGVDVPVGTFVMNASRFSDVTIGFWGSSFVHEGVHIAKRDSESATAEEKAYAAQYRAISAFALSDFEINYIKRRCGAACQ